MKFMACVKRPPPPALLLCTALVGCGAGGTTRAFPELAVTLETQIGSVDDVDAALQNVIGATSDEWGRLFLLQWNVPEVWVFDGAGRRVGTIGGRGQGPGEFLAPAKIGWFQDTLWISDMGNARISLFDAKGFPVRTIRFSRTPTVQEGLAGYQPAALLAPGRVLAEPGIYSDAVVDGVLRYVPVIVTDEDGLVRGHLYDRSVYRSIATIDLEYAGGRRVFMIRSPISQESLVRPHPRGDLVYVVENPPGGGSNLQILVLNASGDTVRSASRDVVRVPASRESLMEHARQAKTERFDAIPDDLFVRAYLESIGDDPGFYRPVTDVVVGRGGGLWLRREDAGQLEIRWERLASDLTVSGWIDLPRDDKIIAADDPHIWVRTTGKFDVTYVEKYRVN